MIWRCKGSPWVLGSNFQGTTVSGFNIKMARFLIQLLNCMDSEIFLFLGFKFQNSFSEIQFSDMQGCWIQILNWQDSRFRFRLTWPIWYVHRVCFQLQVNIVPHDGSVSSHPPCLLFMGKWQSCFCSKQLKSPCGTMSTCVKPINPKKICAFLLLFLVTHFAHSF